MNADDVARALIEEQAEEHRVSRTLRMALDAAVAEKAALRKKLDLLDRIEGSRLEPPRWLSPKTGAEGHATAHLLITDTHFDEVVRPDEIDGLNAYDRGIAEKRLRRAFERFIVLTRDYLSGVTYDGAVVMFGGDMFSGNIHDELKETNTSTLYDAVVHWIEYVEAGLRLVADEFKKVHVVGVVGNHGRTTKKPRSKLRAQDNIDWLLYKFLARDFKSDPRVTFQVSDAPDAMFTVYGTRYLLTHGDQFRGGSGISAALSPLMLGSHRKSSKQTTAGKPYDIMVMGHWHRFMPLLEDGILVGGTMKGYDEYAGTSNFRYAPATQTFWLTTPEHGPTFVDRIFVADREAEGW